MASIFSPLTKNIGIDLGTSTTQVYVEGRGIVLSEPSVMATDERNSKIIAVGRAAEDLLSRSPETVKLHRPLVHGVIADYSVTRTMLGYILSKCVRSVQRLRIMIGVPSAASNVEKRAVMEAVYQAGAKEAFLIETAAAAALGVNLPVYDPVGNMVIDIGGGTTNGSAVLPLEDRGYYFMGRGLDDGLQREMAIKSSELYHIIGKPLIKILDLVKDVLRETPPELAADIMEHGIVLTGGGAKLKGMDQLFTQELGVPVMLASEPELAVAKGTGIAVADRDKLSALIEGAQRIYRRRF